MEVASGTYSGDLNTLQTVLISSVCEWSVKIRGLDGLEGDVIEKLRLELEAERNRVLELGNRIGKEKWRRENPRFLFVITVIHHENCSVKSKPEAAAPLRTGRGFERSRP